MAAVIRHLPDTGSDFGVASRLAEDGYVHIDSDFIGEDRGDVGIAREAFLSGCEEIPPDPHATKNGRNRRFGNFVLHPWSGMLESIPPVFDIDRNDFVARYLQSALANPEQDGKPRGFAPLTEAQRTNLFLRSVIAKSFGVLPWKLHGPVIVGVHLIQLMARPGERGVSSPDTLHRDGEPFTCGFLLDRVSVVGGENFIAAPGLANQHPDFVSSDEILSRFTLKNRFEGWIIDDKRVSHYVSPVSVVAGASIGWRTILLVDFSPAIPGVSLE